MKILIKGQGSKLYEKLVPKTYQKFTEKSSEKQPKKGYRKPKNTITQRKINNVKKPATTASQKPQTCNTKKLTDDSKIRDSRRSRNTNTQREKMRTKNQPKSNQENSLDSPPPLLYITPAISKDCKLISLRSGTVKPSQASAKQTQESAYKKPSRSPYPLSGKRINLY